MEGESKRCQRCGNRIGSPTRGTMTAWLFEEVCTCGIEQAQEKGGRNTPEPVTILDDDSIKDISFGPDYQTLERAGFGGMGVVFKVKETSTGKTFALKVLRPALLSNKDARSRFERELTAASAMSHQSIVSVYDHGYSREGLPFFTMDWIDGVSLSRIIAQEGRLKFGRAISIFTQVAGALAHAHSRGIIHRDLKPSNIMIVRSRAGDERVKLVDFGIAKILPTEERTVDDLTSSGAIVGSPLYMSPEQCLGKELDSRSDLYSFGCVMYEVLTGKPPFAERSPVETIIGHINQPPPLFTSATEKDTVMKQMETVVLRCLEKAPEHRYQNAEQLLDDLKRVRSGATLSSYPQLRYHWMIRLRAMRGTITAAAFVILTGALAMFAVRSMTTASDPPEVQAARWKVENHAAQQQFLTGDLTKAETHFTSALRLAAGSKNPSLESTSLKDLADLKFVQGKENDADAYLKRASVLTSSSVSENVAYQSLLNETKRVIDNPKGGMAAEYYEDLLRRVCDACEGFIDRGSIDQAQLLISNASTIQSKFLPDEQSVRFEKAQLAFHQGRFSESESLVKELLDSPRAAAPLRARGLLLLGKLNTIKGKHDDAENETRDALKEFSILYGAESIQAMTTRVALAECQLAAGKEDEAAATVESINSFLAGQKVGDPRSEARLRYALGIINHQQGQIRKALELCQDNSDRDEHLFARCLVATADSMSPRMMTLLYRRALSISRRLNPPDEALARRLVMRLSGSSSSE